jgi:hypothetical protein
MANIEHSTAKVATFVGHDDDVDHDPKLVADMKQWKSAHPEYSVIYESIDPYGSSGYPLIGTIIYEEVAFGRQFITYEPGSGRKEFTLRNIITGHKLHLSILTNMRGEVSVSTREHLNYKNTEPYRYYVVDE